MLRVQPLLWSIKEKSCSKQRYSKTLLTSLIKTLFTDQPTSLGINTQINTLILLDISCKQEPLLTIQSAISVGESVKVLASHNKTIFFSNESTDRLMAHKSTLSARSPPIPEFNALHGVKYLRHSFKYFETPAIMESPTN